MGTEKDPRPAALCPGRQAQAGTGTKARMPGVGRSAESWGARQPARMGSSSDLLLLPDHCLGTGVVSWCFLNMCRVGSSLFLTPSDEGRNPVHPELISRWVSSLSREQREAEQAPPVSSQWSSEPSQSVVGPCPAGPVAFLHPRASCPGGGKSCLPLGHCSRGHARPPCLA